MFKKNNIFNKLLYLTKSNLGGVIYIVILYILSSFIDLLSLGIIGTYVAFILEPSLLNNELISLSLLFWANMINISNLVISTGLLLILLFAIKAAISIYIHSKIINFSHFSQTYLRINLFKAYQGIPYKYFTSRDTSEFSATMGNYVKTYGTALASGLQLLGDLVTSLFIIIFLIYVNGLFVILMSIGALSFLLFYRFFFVVRLKKHGETMTKNYKYLYQSISEYFLGFKELKILNSFSFFKERIIKSSTSIAKSDISQQIILLSPRFLFELLVVIFIVGIVIYSEIIQIPTIELIPILSIFAVASVRLAPIAYQIIRHLGTFDYSLSAIDKIIKDYDFLKNKDGNFKESNSNSNIFDFQELVFDDVSFSYNNSPLFNEIKLKIEKNESVAVIGESGAGKSTLINLILGLINPDKGKILINQIEQDLSIVQFRNQVAYLPQEIFLINDSIAANISLSEKITDTEYQKLIESTKQAKIFEFINKLPNKFDTKIGEKGINISGGQRQRIAIARAIYFDREVLIFDEPTSSLDKETELEIVEYLKYLNKSKTIIIISHSTELMSFCDKVYLLQNNQIKEIKDDHK